MIHLFALRAAHRSAFEGRRFAAVLVIALAGVLAGCGSSSRSVSLVSPVQAVLQTIAVDPPVSSLALGLKTQFTATGIYDDGTQQDISTKVLWTSANPAVAEVSTQPGSNGRTTALSTGSVTITATLGGISGSSALTVTPAALEFIAVTPTKSTISTGSTQQFTAIGIYSDNSTQDLSATVVWSSTAATVATISNAAGTVGVATAVNPGTTTIIATTATASGVTGSTTLTVGTAAAILRSIAVTPAGSTIASGVTLPFVATGTYADGSTHVITAGLTWTSAAPAIASIDAAGLAKGLSVGGTVITASVGTVSGSTVLTVTAPTLVSLAVTPAGASIVNHTTLQFTAIGTYTDASTQNLTATATWNSTQPAVATIGNAAGIKGLATAVNPGTTQISAVSGTVTAPAVTLTVTPGYAYAANKGANSISQYVIDTDGTLTPNTLGATIATTPGTAPFAMVVDPSARYLYVVDNTSNDVSQFLIGTGGALQAMAVPTVPTGGAPNGLAVDHAGTHAYVANFNDGTVSQYSIGVGGALTELAPPVAAGPLVNGFGDSAVAVDPTDRFAYVANYGVGTVSEYTIAADGTLVPMAVASIPSGINPNAIVVDPTGRFVYTVNFYANTLSQYAIGGDGALTSLGADVAAGTSPRSIAIDANGAFAYVTSRGDGTVLQYTIGPAGLLNPLAVPVSLGAGSSPEGINVDPTNRYVYTANRGAGTVSQLSIGANGALTLLAPPSVPAQDTTTAVVSAY